MNDTHIRELKFDTKAAIKPILLQNGIETVDDIIENLDRIKSFNRIGPAAFNAIMSNPVVKNEIEQRSNEVENNVSYNSASVSEITVSFSPEEVEMLLVCIGTNMSMISGVSKTRQSIIEKLNGTVNVSSIQKQIPTPEPPVNKIPEDFYRIKRWINAGDYHTGADIKLAVKDYIANADDKDPVILDFNASYIKGITNGFTISNTTEYKLVVSNRGDGDIFPRKRK